MRRSKAERMKSAIHSYLKRRRYSGVENNLKTEESLVHTKKELAVMAIVDKEVARCNSVIYSNIANDTGQVDHQFSRLKSWIADLKMDTCRYELATLLCPLFCHLYLEMLCGSHRQSATKFFKRHQALFASRENTRELLEELASVSTSQDMETNSYVKAFRSSKYHLKLSTQGVSTLQKYLSDHGHVLILQMMQKWFDIEIFHAARQDREDDNGTAAAVQNNSQLAGQENDREMSCNKDLKEVTDIIQRVKEATAPQTALLLYVISNAYQNCTVSCASTTQSVSMLAAGVDSCVKVWGLTQKLTFSPDSSLTSPSTPIVLKESSDENPAISLYGHSGPVQDIKFLPRSKSPGVMLSVSQDGSMRSWRLDNYTCLAVYKGHNHEVWCVDTSSLEIYAATGSRDKTARVWSLERKYPLRTFAGHLLDVECIKFHPNNLYFATGSADKTVRMWSVNDARLLRLFHGHRGPVQAVAFSPDGKFLASAGEDRRVKIWDLAAGKLFKECKGHSNSIISLSWSRDNEHVSSCSHDGTVRLWNIQNQNNSSSESSAGCDLVHTFTIGSGLLSIGHSLANKLVCVAVT